LQAVSFQPLLSKSNQDRVATLRWTLAGRPWLFLAVCDGHAGTATSDYTARKLPGRIHAALSALPPAALTDPVRVAKLLQSEVEAFDRHIGKVLRRLCPRPASLSRADADALIRGHEEVLQRANHGTTLAAALVNLDAKLMWAVGVGDSTVGALLSVTTASGKWERLNELHRPTNPKEYFRVAMEHPGEQERAILRDSDRVLGAISLTRAIGDFSMKLPRAYLENLLQYLPTTAHPEHIANILEHSRTPPYLSATPSVRTYDLAPLWADDPMLLVFSDGVDALVEGAFVFRPDDPSTADPCAVLAQLLQDAPQAHAAAAATLGHAVQAHWHANRAVELLGSLVGGTDVRRLARVLDQRLLADRDALPQFRVDDTSIIV
ncbi:phosphatase 2C-like domain-containing protein, partial [Vararia minispora EC-137]